MIGTCVSEGASTRRSSAAPGIVVLFILVALCYAIVGGVLVFGSDSIMGDALTRVAQAVSVWDSRDPKLVNIGFVWTPLPVLLMVLFAPLRTVFPPLFTTGYLAMLMSAGAMAGAVCVLQGLLSDLGMRRTARLVLVVAFAVQPLIVFYGANGMSEALFVLSLMLTARYLVRWSLLPQARHLVGTGIALGLGYLVRYEALAAGAGVVLMVAVVGRMRGGRGGAPSSVGNDVLLVAFPIVMCFALWSVMSWMIVGSPFEQFSSEYGNAALVRTATGAATQAGVGNWPTVVQMAMLAPLLFPLLLIVAARHRGTQLPIAPLAVFGSVLLLESALHLMGSIFLFLRYQIAVIPMLAVLTGMLLTGRGMLSEQFEPSGTRCRPTSRPRHWLAVVTSIIVMLTTMGSGAVTSLALILTSTPLATQEHSHVAPILRRTVDQPAPRDSAEGQWAPDRAIAGFLDHKGLPPGSVLIDNAPGFAIVLASRNPKQFVITSDRDFPAALADPPHAGVRFVMRNEEHAGVDTVRRSWPHLGEPDGPRWARLVAELPQATSDPVRWSLWEVIPNQR